MNSAFWGHVEALRKAVLQALAVIGIAFVLCLWFYEPLFHLLTLPLHHLPQPGATLILLSPIEGATTTIKVAFWSALVGSAPIWGYLLFHFVIPGLLPNEKRFLAPFLFLSFLFMTAGFTMAYFVSLPVASQILYALNSKLGENLWTLSHYIDFAVLFLLAHSLAFELILGLFLMVHFKVVKAETLARQRRFVIVVLFVVAAILTPPDIVTQCLMALPLWVLFEAAVLYGKIRERKRGPAVA